MALSKKETIDKILSFNYEELANWIRSRLHGDDGYFPIFEGHEPNLSEFLTEAFEHIKNEAFRENFLEILTDLTSELWGLTRDKKKIEENKNYIYELLSLCGSIKKFQNKRTLYRIARSGKLKKVNAHYMELHQLLLTTLASYHTAGDYRFWIEQMRDDSNKYYANAAFYALLNRKYDLDIVFKHIKIFIDRFKDEMSLVWGIRALINKYGVDLVSEGFRKIESKLSPQEKEAVNEAFIKSHYPAVYKLDTVPEKELRYKSGVPRLQYISEPTPQYGSSPTLQDRAANIFTMMGFEVELNYEIPGHTIDIFIKKKKMFADKYKCWICVCDNGDHEVDKDVIINFHSTGEDVKEELKKQPPGCTDCGAVIISGKGFTKEAAAAANTHGIEIKTLNELLSDLNSFYYNQKKLIQDFESVYLPGVG